jgi:hypothetical protein
MIEIYQAFEPIATVAELSSSRKGSACWAARTASLPETCLSATKRRKGALQMSRSKSNRRDFLGRTWQLTLGANLGLVGLTQAGCSRETAPEPTEPAPKEPLATDWLGGRKVTPEELKQIHKSPYMLHVEGGELSKVPVEKNL